MSSRRNSAMSSKKTSSTKRKSSRKKLSGGLDWNFIYDREMRLANSPKTYNAIQRLDGVARNVRVECLMRSLISTKFVMKRFKKDFNVSRVMHPIDDNQKVIEMVKRDRIVPRDLHQTDDNEKLKSSQNLTKTNEQIKILPDSKYLRRSKGRTLARKTVHPYNTSKIKLNQNTEGVPNNTFKCDINICDVSLKSNMEIDKGSKKIKVGTEILNWSYTMQKENFETVNSQSVIERFPEKTVNKFAKKKRIIDKKPNIMDSNQLGRRRINNRGLEMTINEFNRQYPTSIDQDVSITDPNALGLPNPGTNRCWFNASLQVIFGLNAFIQDVKNCFKDKEDNICYLFIKLLKCRQQVDDKAFKEMARIISDNLHLVNAMYKDKLQEDAGEFFNYFFNYITHTCGSLLNPVANSIEFTVIETYICQGCGTKYMEQVNTIMFLSIVDENGKCYKSIQNALDACNRPKIMDDCCKNCNGLVSTKSVIKKLPRYLIIQLLRYTAKNGQYVKIDKPIIVENILNVTERVGSNVTVGVLRSANENLNQQSPVHIKEDVGEDESTSKIDYRSVGIIYHEGNSPYSGHYTCDVFHVGSWYHYNDLIVTKFPKSHSEKHAYIIFYELM